MSFFNIDMVSIIVPCYNQAQYLDECLQSVLNQSYQDWELILVNDGSTDDSAAIAEAYARQDARIRFFQKENGGVSSARNMGLSHSRGDYCCFVDADDSIGKDYLQNLIRDMQDDVDLVIKPVIWTTNDGRQIDTVRTCDKEFFSDDLQSLFQNLNIVQFGYSVSALYRKSIISANSVAFPEKIDKCEDLIFVLRYILHCGKIRSTAGSDYFYNVGVGTSLSKKKQSIYTAVNLFKMLYQILRYDFKINTPTRYPNLSKALYFNFHKGFSSLTDDQYSERQIRKNLDMISRAEYAYFIGKQSPTPKAKVHEWFLKNKLIRAYLLLNKIKKR